MKEVSSRVEGCRTVLEVGAGLGVLSVSLADRVSYVNGIEIDYRFSSILREVAEEHPNIDFVIGDILEYTASADCLASNLPYSITGPFLSHMVKHLRPGLSVLTVQKEVASRLAAKAGTGAYGRITVLVQLVYRVELGGVYPPSSFYPPPEVYSQVVVLRMRDDAISPVEAERVENVTRCLFSQRNKRAIKVVRACCGIVLPNLGERRVYELTPEEVLDIARRCSE